MRGVLLASRGNPPGRVPVCRQAVEVLSAFTTVRALIKKQTALFYSLCQQSQQ